MEVDNYPNNLIHPDGQLWSISRQRFLKSISVKGGAGYNLRHNKKGENFTIKTLLETYYPEESKILVKTSN